MITEQDLLSAIAECQGERDPNANTCIKLAAYYTIYNQQFGKSEQLTKAPYMPKYSYSPAPMQTVNQSNISYNSDSDFAKAINGRTPDDIWAIMDELMSTLAILYPRLYDGVMRKIEE